MPVARALIPNSHSNPCDYLYQLPTLRFTLSFNITLVVLSHIIHATDLLYLGLCLVSPPPAGRAGGDPCHIVCLQALGWFHGSRWHPGVQGGLRWTCIPCRWEPLHTGWSLLPLGRPAVISSGSLTTWEERKQFLSSHMVGNEASCRPPSPHHFGLIPKLPLWRGSLGGS